MADWTLHLGDCRPLLATMPGGSVDHVITDPPFAAKTHAGARGARPGVGLVTAQLITTFSSLTDEEFLAFCRECVRVARRWVVMTCDWRHAAVVFCDGRVPVVRCGVWVKPDAAPQFTGDRPGTGWEAVLILHRAGRKRWNGGGHHAVWTCGVERNGLHPTQKPLRLVKDWLRQFTEPGDTVLDPYAGVATTGVACLQTGRRFIGYEVDPNYHALAVKRLEEAAAQRDAPLFEERAVTLPSLFEES